MSLVSVECGYFVKASNGVGGLNHLEDMTVSILADGEILDQQIVASGSVAFPDSYCHISVGLPYESDFETLNIEVATSEGTMQRKKVQLSNTTFRFLNTRGGYIGPRSNKLYNGITKELTGIDDPPPLFNGDIRVPLGGEYKDGGRVFYQQRDPLPVTITAVIPEMAIGGVSG
jgi:hypothetical protein